MVILEVQQVKTGTKSLAIPSFLPPLFIHSVLTFIHWYFAYSLFPFFQFFPFTPTQIQEWNQQGPPRTRCVCI